MSLKLEELRVEERTGTAPSVGSRSFHQYSSIKHHADAPSTNHQSAPMLHANDPASSEESSRSECTRARELAP